MPWASYVCRIYRFGLGSYDTQRYIENAAAKIVVEILAGLWYTESGNKLVGGVA